MCSKGRSWLMPASAHGCVCARLRACLTHGIARQTSNNNNSTPLLCIVLSSHSSFSCSLQYASASHPSNTNQPAPSQSPHLEWWPSYALIISHFGKVVWILYPLFVIYLFAVIIRLLFYSFLDYTRYFEEGSDGWLHHLLLTWQHLHEDKTLILLFYRTFVKVFFYIPGVGGGEGEGEMWGWREIRKAERSCCSLTNHKYRYRTS